MKKTAKKILITLSVLFVLAIIFIVVSAFIFIRTKDMADEIAEDAINVFCCDFPDVIDPYDESAEDARQSEWQFFKDGDNWVRIYDNEWYTDTHPYEDDDFYSRNDAFLLKYRNFIYKIINKDKKNKSISFYSDKEDVLYYDREGIFEAEYGAYHFLCRKQEKTEVVTITAVVDCYGGHAEKDFQITVLGKPSIQKEDVVPITAEQIKTNSYGKEMVFQEQEGKIQRLIGDFNGLESRYSKDAEIVADAYKASVGLPEWVELGQTEENKCRINGKAQSRYCIYLLYNGLRLDNQNIVIYTNGEQKVIQIDFNLNDDLIKPDEALEVLKIEDVLKEYSDDKSISEYQVIQSEDDMELFYEKETFVLQDEYYNEAGEFCQNAVWKSSSKPDVLISFNLNTGIYSEMDNFCSADHPCWNEDHNHKYESESEKGELLNFKSSKKGYFVDYENNIHVQQLLYGNSKGMYNKKRWVKIEKTGVPIETETMKYLQDAYDWYEDMFDYSSFDGRGTKLNAYVNSDRVYDNAYWVPAGRCIEVCQKKNRDYTFAVWPETLAHEYTHGIHSCFISGENNDVRTIKEAYADIMACLIVRDNDWKMFTDDKGASSRDLSVNMTMNDYKEPGYETRRDGSSYYTEYCHDNSIIISNIAYQMMESGLFTYEDCCDIWFSIMRESLGKNNHFGKVRDNMSSVLRKGNYTDKQTEFILNCFDKKGIYGSDEFVINETEKLGFEPELGEKRIFILPKFNNNGGLCIKMIAPESDMTDEQKQTMVSFIEEKVNKILSDEGVDFFVSVDYEEADDEKIEKLSKLKTGEYKRFELNKVRTIAKSLFSEQGGFSLDKAFANAEFVYGFEDSLAHMLFELN